jgi:CheY-like chemotaxis protein
MESNRLKLLLVEDDPDIRAILSHELHELGIQTSIAHDGREALELLNQGDTLPDVIVSNFDMPRMDGAEMLDAIRGNAHLHDIPVILMTAEFTEHHSVTDADALLRKPFEIEELVDVIGRVHRRRQLQTVTAAEDELSPTASL